MRKESCDGLYKKVWPPVEDRLSEVGWKLVGDGLSRKDWRYLGDGISVMRDSVFAERLREKVGRTGESMRTGMVYDFEEFECGG